MRNYHYLPLSDLPYLQLDLEHFGRSVCLTQPQQGLQFHEFPKMEKFRSRKCNQQKPKMIVISVFNSELFYNIHVPSELVHETSLSKFYSLCMYYRLFSVHPS